MKLVLLLLHSKPTCTKTSDTFPSPYVFVGVLTQIKISWASWIAWVMFVEKNRFLLRHALTTSSNPGCKTEHKIYQQMHTLTIDQGDIQTSILTIDYQ